MLRAKGEKNDLAFAVSGFGERGFAVQIFFAEHPARHQRVFVGVRARFVEYVVRLLAITSNAELVDEIRRRLFEHSLRVRMTRVDFSFTIEPGL